MEFTRDFPEPSLTQSDIPMLNMLIKMNSDTSP